MVTDIQHKGNGEDKAYTNKEKFKGHFDLLVNSDLPMNKKIEKYAHDPVVFYLHKN